MKAGDAVEQSHGEGRGGRRRTRELLKLYLQPVEPDARFSRRLEDLCQSMGGEEIFQCQWAGKEEAGRRGYLIGGAICSALPFLGVAAYAISKHLLRRRVVPMGV